MPVLNVNKYPMNLHDLTVNQLKRAAAIKEQIENLHKELRAIVGAPAMSGAAPKKNRTMSASVKRKIAAAQKARWANLRRAKSAALSVKPAAKAKKKSMSPAAKAKLSAKLKAFWAAKKAGKK
ncbi:MAG: hypothetical protein Q8S00_02140 [Deltaproteobacteria bacterium]|nr:hypothetical protein [Deltaproteobacteria bacterium]MDZ4344501.1 hypothetical protein [Candidatus Binatia bacterium]